MSSTSKNTDLRFLLDGQEVNAPVNWKDISVLATFENDNVQANITLENFDFVLEAKQIIDSWIDQGRIFEGLPFQILAFNQDSEVIVFDGFLDLANEVEILQDSQRIKVNIAKSEGLNRLDEQLQGLTYGLLLDEGIITDADFVDVKYVIDKPNSTLDNAILAFLATYLIDATIQQVQEVSDRIAEIAAFQATPPLGVVASAILATAKLLAEAIKLAALVLALADLGRRIFNALFEPVRTHKAMRLSTALQKALEKLGYGFETDIANFDNYVYLPSNNGLDVRGEFAKLVRPAVIRQGIPKSSDYGYACIEMFELAKRYFNAKVAVRNGVVQFRPKGSEYWQSQANYTMPDVLINSQRYNTDELAGDKIIRFDTDVLDAYTIEEETFKGTNYEVITQLQDVSEDRNFIKGLEEVNLNVCLGNRKDQLSILDQSLKIVASIFDTTINVFGGRSNLTGQIDAKTNVLRVSDNNHSKPKLLYLSNGRIPSNQRNFLSAKHSYDNYHVYDSFVDGEGQKIRYSGVRTGFGLENFLQVVENSYIRNVNGEISQVEKIEWNLGGDNALFDYFVRRKYTEALIEKKLQG